MEACVLICRTDKPDDKKGKMLLIDAKTCISENNKERYISDEDIARIADTYHRYIDQERFSRVITIDEAKAQDYSLVITKYIQGTFDFIEAEDDIDYWDAVSEWQSSSGVMHSEYDSLLNTLFGPIAIQVGWNIPFATFLFSGFMRGIPKDLEDAAYIDGCSTFGVYRKIFLPLLAPVTASCCIVSGLGIWNDYLVSKTNLKDTAFPTLMVGMYTFFGAKQTEYGYAFAGVLLTSVPMMILFLFLQKYFIKGIAAGSVKG